jgi:AcrR family transcriptional regulator
MKGRLRGPERRRRILEAAEAVFAEDGFQAASMNAIAAAAGVTKPILYDHFPSKLGLMVAVMEAIRDDLLARGGSAIAIDASAEERMRAGLAAFFSLVQDRPTAVTVLFERPRGDAALEDHALRIQQEATCRLADLLQGIVGPMPPGLAEIITEFIKEGVHGLARWSIARPEVERDHLVEAVVMVIWHGLAALHPGPWSKHSMPLGREA